MISTKEMYGKRTQRRRPTRASRRTKKKTSKSQDYGKGAISLRTKGLTMAPLGDKLFTKLRLTNVLASTTGTFNDAVIKLNSLFDPFQNEGADKPIGYDQLANFFERYKVYGVKVKWTTTNEVANPVGIVCSMTASEDETAFTDLDTVLSHSAGKYKVITGGNGGISSKVFSKYYSVPNILGVSKKAYAGDISYSSLITSEPSTGSTSAFLHLTTATLDATTTIDMRGIVDLTFYCEFSQRKLLGIS